MYTLGIDIGSTTSKCAVLKDGTELVGKSLQRGGLGTDGPAEALAALWRSCGLTRADMTRTVVTGYGRKNYQGADSEISELTAHAMGGRFVFPDLRTVIDIGGQDAKVIALTPSGRMSNFVMNDKCAAGTGRFLEVMANTLSLRPNEMFDLARLGSDTTISSMCTVFAESEVIGLIGKGEPKENIAYAVVDSTIRKVAAQVSRMNGEMSTFCLTGGLCECEYIRGALSKKLGKEVISSPDARYAGAIGAALSAMKIR